MFVSMYGTAGTEKEAGKIVKELLKKKLIACANIFPISSIYYWENKLEEEAEVGIIMKTREQLVDKVITEFKNLHSYDVPCIVSWKIDKGFNKYLAWVGSETNHE
jgi:periplasmic divalent cation tolerance protein